MRKEAARQIPTMKQIADRAGVSVATVSRVLSHQGGVSENLVTRVQDAAAALHYVPDRSARRLRTRTAQLIGVAVSDIENPFYTSVIRGIELVIEDIDYSLMVLDSDEDANRERRWLQVLQEERAAGIIIAPTDDNVATYRSILESNVPVVFIDRYIEGAQVDSVTVQNESGALAAVTHLVDQGHVRIAFIGGRDQISTARDRKQGYLRALNTAGIPPQPELMRNGDFRHSGGYQTMRELLELSPSPTAVFVANNLMALGALRAIHEYGRRIPNDIAIVGFDDMLWAASLNPPLSAVAQPAKDIGQMAAELLVGRIKEPNRTPCQAILQTYLNIRASSVMRVK